MTTIEEKGLAIDVLLVEDRAGDVRLAQEAFRAANGAIRLHLAADGMEAMAFLRREGKHVGAPRPDLVLLDLSLPKMNGHEVLAQIKQDERLKAIPVVVLTSSDMEADISTSYQLQANCHLRKPTHWEAFEGLVSNINAFWLAMVKLPHSK